MENKNKLQAFYPLFFVLMLLIGVVVGANLFRNNTAPAIINLSGLTGGGDNSKLSQIIQYIDEEYVDTIQKQELIDNTINHLLKQLDPHSFYIPAADLQRVQEPLEGNFEGIGIEFRIQEDTIVVVNAIPGGPSESVGIMAGDRIVMVDDSLVAGVGITNDMVIGLLRGEKGSKVKVAMLRKSKTLPFKITRGKIPIYSVTANFMLNHQTGYIKINRFAKTTYDEFMDAVDALKKQGMQSMVLDLRGNGGGLLSVAIAMCEEFLTQGQLIVYTEGKAQPKEEYYARRNGSLSGMPLAVLIDEGSASASEILAGAVQDNDRGWIIGRRSFGKGLVQNQIPLADESALRLTIARYYTPTGRCIQKPYGEGIDYNNEYEERFERGELQEVDSIVLNDSLKYITPKGKIVYGGGGIVPDEFVGLDTTGASWYFSELNYAGTLFQFAFNYVDNNREQLKKYNSLDAYVSDFKLTNAILNDLTTFATSEGVKFRRQEFEHSKEQIRLRLKALIGRNLFQDNGFYKTLAPTDNTIKKGVDKLSQSTVMG
jgi:carboxyl-terminal processing protease